MHTSHRLLICTLAGAALLASSLGPCLAQTSSQDQLDDTDSQFLRDAIRTGVTEAAGAQAHSASNDANVSLYAKTVVKDDALSNSQLEALAKQYNIPFDTSTTGAASAPSTPAEYMHKAVDDDQAALALFQKEANGGTDAAVKTLAARMVPVVKAHLAMAQQYVSTGTVTPEPMATTAP